ncbi:hypothetical protein OTU49_004306 [Cherax quadricarinatus]|uniref:BTB domain-containing protein n=1 Tax=Cherax quadricarinatus TaxID=27406 RepID=A0AAW0X0N6_CHEQU
MARETCLPYGFQRGRTNDLSNVHERVKALYLTGQFSDLTIRFQGRKETIKAHRLILAMTSPVFEAKLFGHTAVGGELILTEDSPETFSWLMEYMYFDQTQFPSTNMALEVSYLACKYEMNVLKYVCSEYLKRVLSDTNYLMVYNAAVHLDNPDLINKCSKKMYETSGDVFSTQRITQLSRWALQHLLEQPFINIDEVVVFSAVLSWGRHQLGLRNTGCTPSELRREIEDFLPYLRFLTMSTDEFVENVVPTEIFSPEEICAILRNIKNVKGSPVPKACANTREKRNKMVKF